MTPEPRNRSTPRSASRFTPATKLYSTYMGTIVNVYSVTFAIMLVAAIAAYFARYLPHFGNHVPGR